MCGLAALGMSSVFDQAGDMFSAVASSSQKGLHVAARAIADGLDPQTRRTPRQVASWPPPSSTMLSDVPSGLGGQTVVVLTLEQAEKRDEAAKKKALMDRATRAQSILSAKAKIDLREHARSSTSAPSWLTPLLHWRASPEPNTQSNARLLPGETGERYLRRMRIEEGRQQAALAQNRVYQAQKKIDAENAKKQERENDLIEIKRLVSMYSFLEMPPDITRYNIDLKATIKDMKSTIERFHALEKEDKKRRRNQRAAAQAVITASEAQSRANVTERTRRRTANRDAFIDAQALKGLELKKATSQRLRKTKSI